MDLVFSVKFLLQITLKKSRTNFLECGQTLFPKNIAVVCLRGHMIDEGKLKMAGV